MVWKVIATIRSVKQEQKLRKKNHPKKFAATLASKRYPQDLIEPNNFPRVEGSCLTSLQPFGPQKVAFYGRSVCHLVALIDNSSIGYSPPRQPIRMHGKH